MLLQSEIKQNFITLSNGEIFSFRLERGIKAGGEIGEGVMKGKEVSEEGN